MNWGYATFVISGLRVRFLLPAPRIFASHRGILLRWLVCFCQIQNFRFLEVFLAEKPEILICRNFWFEVVSYVARDLLQYAVEDLRAVIRRGRFTVISWRICLS